MKIIIDDLQPVSLIREQFNRQFPCLKLEFVPKVLMSCRTSLPHHKEDFHRKIGELRQTRNTGVIEVLPEMSALEVERVFRQQYGLDVQVLRRCGNTWLETTQTAGWTLSSLNSRAEADSLLCCYSHL